MTVFNHPILLAAVTVAAIGVVIYELLNGANRPHGARPHRPPRDDPPWPPRDDSPKKPPANSKPPSTSDNTLRKRNIDQTSVKKSSSDDFKKSTETSSSKANQNIHDKNFDKVMPDKLNNDAKSSSSSVNSLGKLDLDPALQKSSSDDLKKSAESSSTNAPITSTETSSTKVSEDVQDKKFNENNYCKNILDKLSNDTKEIDEKFKSEKNIFEEECVSPENNLSAKVAKKSSNQMTSDACNSNKQVKRLKKSKNVKKSFENIKGNVKHNASSDNSDGYESESEKSSSSDENIYKMEVHNTLKNDIHSMNEASKTNDCDRMEDKPNMVMIDPSDKPAESKICKACEENPINTRAYPCGHSYLCVDCAARIFRIYKKCKECFQHVEEFVRFSS